MRVMALAAMLAASPAMSQTLPSNIDGVVRACSTSDGGCQAAVANYLQVLQRAGLPEEEYAQRIADLVVALATFASEDGACNSIDEQVAVAISYTGGFAGVGQVAQIGEISDAVAACSEVQTAAITSEIGEAASEN